jgi:hypothetical protein
MRRHIVVVSQVLSLSIFTLLITSTLNAADMTVEDLVAKHLASIGSPEARNAKTRVSEGAVTYKILVGGSGEAAGKFFFVSEGVKRQLMMKINDRNYRGEQWIYDGDKDSVSFSLTQQKRSQFGEFLYTQPVPLREGLLGGLLTTAWPLLDPALNGAKLNYQGLKKVDGRDLHDLVYKPKKGTDYEIHIYLDPETFHHVLTVYTITIQPQMRFHGDTLNVRQVPERHRIEERFSDFKQFDGLTLPTQYELKYTQELQTGGTTLFVWDIAVSQITNGVSVDPRNFEVK